MNTETLLREHFEKAADAVEIAPAPLAQVKGGVRRTRIVIGVAAAAAVIVVVGVVGLTRGGPDELVPPTAPAVTEQGPAPSAAALAVFDAEIISLLPPDFDPWNAPKLHTQVGTPEFAALAYLGSRLPDMEETLGVEILEVVDAGYGFSAARWAFGDALDGVDDPTNGFFAGWVLMRDKAGTQDVLASTTDRVDLSDLRIDDGVVVGEVTSSQIDALALDLLSLDLQPIPSSPLPEGRTPEREPDFASKLPPDPGGTILTAGLPSRGRGCAGRAE